MSETTQNTTEAGYPQASVVLISGASRGLGGEQVLRQTQEPALEHDMRDNERGERENGETEREQRLHHRLLYERCAKVL